MDNEDLIAKSGNRQMGPMAQNTDETCEMPEMPSGMQGGFGGREEFMTQDASASSDSILHPAAYLAIGGGSVVLGILISYACFSRFFHAKPGEAFSTVGKFIGFIAVALALAVGICVLGYFIPVWCS